MSDVALTRILEFRSDYMNGRGLDSAELNSTAPDLLRYFLRQNLFNSELLAAGKKFPEHVVREPVLNDDGVILANSITATVPDNPVESAFVDYVYTPYVFKFTIRPEEYAFNEVPYRSVFNEKMRRGLEQMVRQIESEKCHALLEADKNQAWSTEILGVFAGGQVGDALQISVAERNLAYNKLNHIEALEDFQDTNLDVIASTLHMPLIEELGAQGIGNAENQQFQLGNFNFTRSNRIPTGTGNQGTIFVLPPNSVGIGHWIPPVFTGQGIESQQDIADINYGVTPIMPMLGMPLGYRYEAKEDVSTSLSNSNGIGLTKVETYQFMTYITSKSVYNSDRANRFNPIFKAEFKSS